MTVYPKDSCTGIIDYGIGNVRSVYNAIKTIGGTPILTSSRNKLKECAILFAGS